MEENRPINLEKVTYTLIASFLLVFLLIIAEALFIPIIFGIIFALVLLPISEMYERRVKNRILSIILTFLTVLLPLLGLITFFVYEFIRLIRGLPSIGDKVGKAIYAVISWLQQHLDLGIGDPDQWVQDNLGLILNAPLAFLASSLASSTTLIAGLIIAALYTFFFLLYRSSFRNFFVYQFGEETRGPAINLLNDIQSIMTGYLFGLGLVMLILGALNSIGLWVIGVDYALFWGFLASFLGVIPYVGTTIGGTLPFLYALATAGNFWQPAAVVALYVGIQQLEGNFITPKIVGSSVQLNPLAAIVSLLIGGAMWGIPGLILAIPVMAALRVAFSRVDFLKPYGLLLSDDFYENSETFEKQWDESRYRLINFFRRAPEERKKQY